MAKIEIVLAGVGGQGLVSAGGMLAEAAATCEKREALMCCAYGSEARGTFTKAEVIIDDSRIYFPEVQIPDVVVALHQIAYERYVDALDPASLIIYDSAAVTPRESNARQQGIAISKLAEEAGAVASSNVVMLGILSAMYGVASIDSLKKMVEKKFAGKPAVIEKNFKALEAGFNEIEK